MRPLQALAALDPLTGSILLEQLGISLLRNAQGLDDQIVAALQAFLQNSRGHGPLLAALLLVASRQDAALATLHPADVARAAELAAEEPIGIHFLQAQLHYRPSSVAEPVAKAGRRDDCDGARDTRAVWLALARLYRGLGDSDSLRAIQRERLDASPALLQALEAEEAGEFAEAVKAYNAAIADANTGLSGASDVSLADYELDSLALARSECLVRLGRWDRLATTVRKDLVAVAEPASLGSMEEESEEDRLSRAALSDGREKELGLLVRGTVRWQLEAETAESQIGLDRLKRWLSETEGRRRMEASSGSDLALLWMAEGNVREASRLTTTAVEEFLAWWPTLAVGSRDARWHVLQEITPTLLLDSAVKLMAKQKKEGWTVTETLGGLKRLLERSGVDGASCGSAWEGASCVKLLACSRLGRALEGGGQQLHLRVLLDHAQGATDQRNFARAHALVDKVSQLVDNTADSGLLSAYARINAQLNLARIRLSPDPHTAAHNATSLLDALKMLNDKGEEKAGLKGSCLQQLAFTLRQSHSDSFSDELRQSLAAFVGVERVGAVKLAEAYEASALESLRADPSAVLTLIDFCDSLAGEDASSQYARTMVEELAAALRGTPSRELRQRVPRLLARLEQRSELASSCVRASLASVSPWVWLGWLSQLVSLLPSRLCGTMRRVLVGVAESYPQALVYPLKLSVEGFSSTGEEGRRAGEAVAEILGVEGLKALTPRVDKFIQALALLHQGPAALKDVQTSVALEKRELSLEALLGKLRSALSDVFFRRGSGEELVYPVQLGRYWKDFASLWADRFTKLLGKKPKSITSIVILCKRQAAYHGNLRSWYFADGAVAVG